MAPAPGTGYFLERKMKWKMRQSDAEKILAYALNQSSQEIVTKCLTKIIESIPKSLQFRSNR